MFVPVETKSADASTHMVLPGESLWPITRSRLGDKTRADDIFAIRRKGLGQHD
ncbi:hypothetical protein [Sphingomonas rubra]|uniref:Uncharacterized protein n=1 Tax=Sphingomonas rubra TaxID=634430 RepID=A0A1I5U563_9SPHN|nr:hypothetical protein [Sphingomonas rubra]SFP90445.1 hypothetical protein SAMN04488241_110129 [Sphingomonas rubra]